MEKRPHKDEPTLLLVSSIAVCWGDDDDDDDDSSAQSVADMPTQLRNLLSRVPRNLSKEPRKQQPMILTKKQRGGGGW